MTCTHPITAVPFKNRPPLSVVNTEWAMQLTPCHHCLPQVCKQQCRQQSLASRSTVARFTAEILRQRMLSHCPVNCEKLNADPASAHMQADQVESGPVLYSLQGHWQQSFCSHWQPEFLLGTAMRVSHINIAWHCSSPAILRPHVPCVTKFYLTGRPC